MASNGTPSTGSPTVRRPQPVNPAPLEEKSKLAQESSLGLDPAAQLLSNLNIKNEHSPGHNPLVDTLLKQIENGEARHPLPRKPVNSFKTGNDASTTSMPLTPAENFSLPSSKTHLTSTNAKENNAADDEVARLQQQLAAAQSKIHELSQTRDPNVDALPGPSFESQYDDTSSRLSITPAMQPGHASALNNNSWTGLDDGRSDNGDSISANGFNRARNIWNGAKPGQPSGGGMSGTKSPVNGGAWPSRGNLMFSDSAMPYNAAPASESYRNSDRISPDYDGDNRGANNRRNSRFDRFGGGFPGYGNQGPYGGGNFNNQYGQGPYDGANGQNSPFPANAAPYSSQQPDPIGTALSPLATEFTSGNGHWKSEPATSEGPTYLPTTEPLNYRRLLDRNVNCNWKYIVDKIVCNNDQQASIFLQQKLKVGTPDQKYEIVDAIILQAHPLMVNRFGNFLVQRCFEHGTPEQVIKIAEAIRGNTLSLSMDPFGCHVVQKAFDSVPEDYKAVMVHELLRRIPETIIHRYACHVWQKLFELRWSESPPQIMKYVNESLRGMWHEVALGETGSLVVQNIFENCLEEDKVSSTAFGTAISIIVHANTFQRPCIEEVLTNIDIVAHGQFGNWCIQHICEHGAPADRGRAIDHVIRYAGEYSTDQYASKVVEKCLKIGSGDFLGRYLDRVCEGRVDRPRIPLIDIASDQYGNYLIQWVLTQGNPQHREIVAAHIRKHMVSLRGSKFGSRVGMLCTNPAIATRPGPGMNPNIGRMPGPRYGGRPYQ
ncbi:hypothetical protein KJ359_000835 [Pestalotiopsis sp. 9143b]|nr:hypothetical protein KJ359_000835 [Pestalotiopsis sp. 9143b]